MLMDIGNALSAQNHRLI